MTLVKLFFVASQGVSDRGGRRMTPVLTEASVLRRHVKTRQRGGVAYARPRAARFSRCCLHGCGCNARYEKGELNLFIWNPEKHDAEVIRAKLQDGAKVMGNVSGWLSFTESVRRHTVPLQSCGGGKGDCVVRLWRTAVSPPARHPAPPQHTLRPCPSRVRPRATFGCGCRPVLAPAHPDARGARCATPARINHPYRTVSMGPL